MDAKEKLYFNRKYVEKMDKKIKAFMHDENREERLEKQLCKTCMYINNDIMVMDAFTHSFCKNCGKEMVFVNSDIDIFCPECAKKLNICKHCGSALD